MTVFCESRDCEHNYNGSCGCGIITVMQHEAISDEGATKISVCGEYEVKE